MTNNPNFDAAKNSSSSNNQKELSTINVDISNLFFNEDIDRLKWSCLLVKNLQWVLTINNALDKISSYEKINHKPFYKVIEAISEKNAVNNEDRLEYYKSLRSIEKINKIFEHIMEDLAICYLPMEAELIISGLSYQDIKKLKDQDDYPSLVSRYTEYFVDMCLNKTEIEQYLLLEQNIINEAKELITNNKKAA